MCISSKYASFQQQTYFKALYCDKMKQLSKLLTQPVEIEKIILNQSRDWKASPELVETGIRV